MNHSMVSYVVWISTRDTSHNERNVPNPMLYVGNVSDIRTATQPWTCCNRKEEEGSRIWLGFPHADSSVRNFGTRCSVSCCSSSLVPVPDTVDFKAQIGCRAS